MNLLYWMFFQDREAKWISGTAFVDLEERESRLDGIRKEIEKERRELSKRKPPSMATAQNASHKHRENALRYTFIKFLTPANFSDFNYQRFMIILVLRNIIAKNLS